MTGQPQPGGTPGSKSGSQSGSESGSQDKTDQAKGAAQDVAGDAKDAGQAVKDTAAQEAAGVKDDAVREAKRLGGEATSMLQTQASDQLDRAAQTVRSFSDDIARMARGEKPEAGVAKDLTDQLGSRAEATATWLENHEPKDVLQEVQRFARRRPVAFLAIAAGVGFAAGRLTRGVQQNHSDDQDQNSTTQNPSARNRAAQNRAAQSPAGRTGTASTAPGVPGPPVAGTPAAGTPAAGAPVSGNQTGGAPAYETGPATPTPGYTGGTDPYAGGGRR